MDVYVAREDPEPGVTGALVADAVPLARRPRRLRAAPGRRRPATSSSAPAPATWCSPSAPATSPCSGPRCSSCSGSGVRRCRCRERRRRSRRRPPDPPARRASRPRPDPTRRPCGSPARTSGAAATPAAGARCATWRWPCCSSAPCSAAVWLVFFSRYVTARGRRGHRQPRTSAESRVERAADVPDRHPAGPGRPRRDAARGWSRSPRCASAEVSRSWPHAVHIEVTERTPVAVIDRGERAAGPRRRGRRCSARYGGAAPPACRWSTPDAGTGDEALVEAGRVVAALPARRRRPRSTPCEVASVDEITLVLAQRPPRAVGERGGLRPARPRCSPCCCTSGRATSTRSTSPSPAGPPPAEPPPLPRPLQHRTNFCGISRAPRVLPGSARGRPPTLISPPQVDITLTLYFKVRVLGPAGGLPQEHPRVVRAAAAGHARQ